MELARLVAAVEQVRATSKKSEKIRILADTLRATQAPETALAAMYLSGSLLQGKIGIGYAFGWGDMALSERYQKLSNGDELVNDLELNGLMLDATFHF